MVLLEAYFLQHSFIIIIIIILEKIYMAFSPSELQGHVTMSKS